MDSLLSVAPEGSETYLGYKEGILTSEGHLDEALEISDKRLDMSQAGTHENAIICYGRYSIYRQKGDMDLAKYWLCKSALDDVRNAVMDQMSLIALAELLDAEGDNERASKYISFTWECNRKFSPRMRSWQIAPLLSAIEQNYQEKVDKKSRILTVWTIVITVMLVIFIIGLFFVNRQRKQLRATKEDLEKANKELAQFNSKLELMNKQITKYNKQLLEINKSQSS
jgi:cell division protein FtsB